MEIKLTGKKDRLAELLVDSVVIQRKTLDELRSLNSVLRSLVERVNDSMCLLKLGIKKDESTWGAQGGEN